MHAKRIGKQKQRRQASEDALFSRADQEWEAGNLRSAHRILLTGAKRGDPSAQHNLGYFYRAGLGVKPNRAKALYWYKAAYSHGFRVAASNIANIFRDEKNIPRALAWYQRAARLHDGDANVEIAKLLISTSRQTSAVRYLNRAISAKPRNITQAGRQEAKRLLSSITRKKGAKRVKT